MKKLKIKGLGKRFLKWALLGIFLQSLGQTIGILFTPASITQFLTVEFWIQFVISAAIIITLSFFIAETRIYNGDENNKG